MAESHTQPPALTNVDIFSEDNDEEDLFASAIEDPQQSNPSVDSGGNGQVSSSEEGRSLQDEFDMIHEKKRGNGKVDGVSQSASSTSSTIVSQINYVPDISTGDTSKEFMKKTTLNSRAEKDDDLGDEEDDKFIIITVSEPQKVNEGINAYVQYKLSTETNLGVFKKRRFSVLRRFSDFLALYDKLQEKHTHLGRFVPPAPEKSVAGMAKVKMSKGDSTEKDSASGEFVERRRAALERYLNRTAQHSVLRMDPDFREFLELDGAMPKATNTSAFSGAGVMRLFSKVGEQVNRMTVKMEEKDEWFEEKHMQIDNMETQLKKLHSSVEALFHHRRDLSNSTGSFAKSAAMLANCEEHTSLSRALSQLAETEEKIDLLYQEQSNTDHFLLAELLRDYIGLLATVKEAFHHRIKVYGNWTSAQATLAKKMETKVKLELAGRHDKVQAAQDEVREWEEKVESGEREFEAISKMIKKELGTFEKVRVKDFKATLVKYLEALMLHQQQLVKYWEAFLPEARSISSV